MIDIECSNEEVKQILSEDFQEYTPMLAVNLEKFAEKPELIAYGVPLEYFHDCVMIYLVNETTKDRCIAYVPSENSQSPIGFHVIENPVEIKRAEILFVSCLLFDDFDVSYEFIKNAHTYIDVDGIIESLATH